MIKFNWEILNRYTRGDKQKVVDYISFATYKEKLPQYAINILINKSKRDSFLLNNKEFITNKFNGSIYELYNYLYLASKRNLADYVYKKQLWIPIELCDIPVATNRLLDIIDDKIYFKYEENKCQ